MGQLCLLPVNPGDAPAHGALLRLFCSSCNMLQACAPVQTFALSACSGVGCWLLKSQAAPMVTGVKSVLVALYSCVQQPLRLLSTCLFQSGKACCQTLEFAHMLCCALCPQSLVGSKPGAKALCSSTCCDGANFHPYTHGSGPSSRFRGAKLLA
jgi:hypothetical protein